MSRLLRQVSDILAAIYRGDREEAQRLATGRELDVFEAAALGRVDRLADLLDDDAALANAWADDGFQPLGLASFFGQVDAARLLVERGAEVNSPSRNAMKVMPLHSAAAAREPDVRYAIARLLIEAGADVNARQQDEYTPLMAADQHRDQRLRELLVEHGAIR